MEIVLNDDLFSKKECIKILNLKGEIINTNNFTNIDNAQILKAYKIMNLSRNYEKKAFQLQRQGRMLTFPPSMGQEAIQVAIAMNIKPKYDWFVSGYRDNATWLYLGKPLKEIFQYWCGNEKGSSFKAENRILPVNVLIGTQFSHATGIALANKLRKEECLTIVVIGDGGTSSGEFYSSMNFAATLNLSIIFIIQNNQWAISTPLSAQTTCETLAQKAIAAGIQSLRVDGNDLFASYTVMNEAVKYVKTNKKPILIEALTYRLGPHTTADDPTIYRTTKYHDEQAKTDPLIRLKKYLIKNKLWTNENQENLDQEQNIYIDNEYQAAINDNVVELWDIFKNTYKELDYDLNNQYEQLKNHYQNLKKEIINYESN